MANVYGTLGWLRERVMNELGVNPETPGDAFEGPLDAPFSKIDDPIHEAYYDLVSAAKKVMPRERSTCYEDIVWPSGQVNLQIPLHIVEGNLASVWDITDATPGIRLSIEKRSDTYFPAIRWEGYDTVAWGTSGPSRDTTVRFFYNGAPPIMTSVTEKPRVIPQEHVAAIAWRACVLARMSKGLSLTPELVAVANDKREKYLLWAMQTLPNEPGLSTDVKQV